MCQGTRRRRLVVIRSLVIKNIAAFVEGRDRTDLGWKHYYFKLKAKNNA
jgi:hypothetical protein